MNTPFEFKTLEGDRLVYVRPVDVTDLPDAMQEQAEGRDQVYALHNAEGDRLALVKDRELAFEIALQNDFAPVNVH